MTPCQPVVAAAWSCLCLWCLCRPKFRVVPEKGLIRGLGDKVGNAVGAAIGEVGAAIGEVGAAIGGALKKGKHGSPAPTCESTKHAWVAATSTGTDTPGRRRAAGPLSRVRAKARTKRGAKCSTRGCCCGARTPGSPSAGPTSPWPTPCSRRAGCAPPLPPKLTSFDACWTP